MDRPDQKLPFPNKVNLEKDREKLDKEHHRDDPKGIGDRVADSDQRIAPDISRAAPRPGELVRAPV